MNYEDPNLTQIVEKHAKFTPMIRKFIEKILKESSIEIVSIESRTKTFESVMEKMDRKITTLEEIEDISGIRVITYFLVDVVEIGKVIEQNLIVHKSDKRAIQLSRDPTHFGYTSDHFTVFISQKMAKSSEWEEFSDIKAEIQVRTIPQHAWASTSHKLHYKKEEEAPSQFRRKLSRLSALLEEVDEIISSLKKAKEENMKEISKGEIDKDIDFDLEQEINSDSIQVFLDKCFPERSKNVDTSDLLDELFRLKVTFENLLDYYNQANSYINKVEEENINKKRLEKKQYSQVGALRCLLLLTNDQYFNDRSMIAPDQYSSEKEWREKIKKGN